MKHSKELRMNPRSIPHILAALAVAFALAGCASRSRIQWGERIGSFTYDDAIKEYGPPDRKETTSDGVLVAEWTLHRGQVYSYPSAGAGWGWRSRWGWPGTDVHSTPDQMLRLQFGPDARLRVWKEFYR